MNYQKSVGIIAKSRNNYLKTAMSTNHKAGGFYNNSYEASNTNVEREARNLIQARTLSQGQFATHTEQKNTQNIKNLLSTAFTRD